MNTSRGLAIAFDLGTTTIAASLVDTVSGERLATGGVMNPQRQFGLDVVSRLNVAVASEEELQNMKWVVNDALQQLAMTLLERAGKAPESLQRVAIAGNPAMEHILLGLPVRSLAFPPHRPLFTSSRLTSSLELGWELDVEAWIFPLPGGFVGGDLVAFLHGRGVGNGAEGVAKNAVLYIDLGTNGEIALIDGGKVIATSAAAGPAFEGGNLACGMAAVAGAISGINIDGDRVMVSAIGNVAPTGICGSGVIEAVSELIRVGMIDSTGRLLLPAEISTNLANRVTETDQGAAFILHRDSRGLVFLNQKDIREVQLAKAAISAGIKVLEQRAGAGGDGIERVELTGSFGAVLKPQALKNIGILSEKMVKKCAFFREGALAGVEKAVSAAQGLAQVEELAKFIKVVPLSGTPLFEKHFLEQMNFPNYQP